MKVQFSEYFTAGIKAYYNGLATRYDIYRSCVADKEYNSGFCRYCFSQHLQSASLKRMNIKYDPTILRATDPKPMRKRFSRIFDEGMINPHDFREWAVLRRWVPETGCDGETFQPADKKLGLTYEYMEMAKNYRFPMWVCSKGHILADDTVNDKYFDLIGEVNKNSRFYFDMTLMGLDDDKVRKVEPTAPLPSERLEIIDRLTEMGVPVIISCRPFMRGITDVDWDEYIETLCQKGVEAIHIRQFYVFGTLLKKWKGWVEENKDVLVKYGGGYKYDPSYLDGFFERAMEIAEPYGTDIVGHSSRTFDKSHKMDIDALGEEDKKYFFPYTILPIWRMATDGVPKLITYDDFEQKVIKPNEPDPLLDTKINIDFYSFILFYIKCTQTKNRVVTSLPFREVLRRALWEGTGYKDALAMKPKDVYRIDPSEYMERNEPVYAYLPGLNQQGKEVTLKTVKSYNAV